MTAARATGAAGATVARDVRDDRLSLLLDLGAVLSREVGLDALLGEIASRVARALEAERATVFVVVAASGELRSHIAVLPELPEIRLALGQGIAGSVAQSGRAINVTDAGTDPRLYPEIDRATGYRTRTVLAAPILDTRRAIRGVVQVINKHAGPFTPSDEAFEGYAQLASHG